ncbi:MAG: LamG-like jellyroll fold domain-containing protein [Patescibacteria group bacterium]|jgi:prepilin-type N-terminal cleavage/methylation domain-containing protein
MFLKIFIKTKKTAFTLTELLVAIFIIVIISSLFVVSVFNSRQKGRDFKRVSDINQVQIALENYHRLEGVYPDTLTAGESLTGPTTGITFLDEIPENSPYYNYVCSYSAYDYVYDDVNDSYGIAFCLEEAVESYTAGVKCATPTGILNSDCLSWEGLIARYSFEGNADDSSGNDFDGTVHGAVLTTGKYGQGYILNGTSDYIQLPSSNSMLSGAPFTIGAWFKTDKDHTGAFTAQGRIITMVRSDSGARLSGATMILGETTKRIQFGYNDGSTWRLNYYDTPSTYYYDNSWHHMAVTHSGSVSKVYYDGVEVATSNNTFGSFGADFTSIGSLSDPADPRYFKGILDEIYIFEEVLSQPNIVRLMQGLPPL